MYPQKFCYALLQGLPAGEKMQSDVDPLTLEHILGIVNRLTVHVRHLQYRILGIKPLYSESL